MDWKQNKKLNWKEQMKEQMKERFYLMHSTHFICGYMVLDVCYEPLW